MRCYVSKQIHIIFANLLGAIAQLVEQRTENPCVPGSNPGSTTKAEYIISKMDSAFLFFKKVLFIVYI